MDDKAHADVEEMMDIVARGEHSRDGMTGDEREGGFVEFGGKCSGTRLSDGELGDGFGGEVLVANAHDGFVCVGDEDAVFVL